ncbi:MAG: DegT/DnrJ/EryC1/StrS family aminotransferase, partial [Planctomycetota bacterium]
MDDAHAKGDRRLAIEGGTPVRTEPLPPWPSFAEDEIAAVVDVLRSGRVNQWTGHHVTAFEREFAEFCGARHAVAVANGTVALEAVLTALGIGPGDDVVVTARSFVASASCAAIRGANVVFADVDRNSQNVTADTIAAVLTPRTKTIIAVHLAGWPCDMEPILELAQRRRLWVVEDCAQAHGARYRGRSVGTWGHAAAFSFCQDKIMTTGGEGGMVVTNDPDIHRRVWEYKDHGKSLDALRADA